MRENVLRSVQILSNPFAAGAVALFAVVAAGAIAASHLPRPYTGSIARTVERVMVKQAPVENVSASAVPVAAPSIGAPQIARTAKVSLYVGSVAKSAAAVARAAKRNGGAVFASDLWNGDGTAVQPNGTMEIRIPARRFDQAMAAVMGAGTVREDSTSAQDLTGDITDSDARLRNLRQTEDDIRRIMDRSGNVAQIMDAENQLSHVREQIETLESDLKEMRGRVAYATIDVDMQAQVRSRPVTPTTASQLVSAWQGALSSLGALTIGIASVLLWLVAFAPYIVGIAGMLWIVRRKMLMHRGGTAINRNSQ